MTEQALDSVHSALAKLELDIAIADQDALMHPDESLSLIDI